MKKSAATAGPKAGFAQPVPAAPPAPSPAETPATATPKARTSTPQASPKASPAAAAATSRVSPGQVRVDAPEVYPACYGI